MKNKVVAVVGPTASGKSALAVDIAKKYGGEVVSADSMQIYRKMDIGTAKIRDTEGVPHHLIDIVDPSETYTLSDYLSDADRTVKDILSRGKLPVMAGGTGLYISSFIDNIQLTEAETDEEYREYLKNFADSSSEVYYLIRDIDNDGTKDLILSNKASLTIYTYTDSVKEVGSYDFITGTVRYLYSDNKDFPGIFYTTTGGGYNHCG